MKSLAIFTVFFVLILAVTPLLAKLLFWDHQGTPVCTENNTQTLNNFHVGRAGLAGDTGGAIWVWSDERDSVSAGDIYAQRMNPIGRAMWQGNGTPICTAPGWQTDARVVSDGQNGAIICWMDGRSLGPPDIYAQRVDSTGAALWTKNGVPVCTTVHGQEFPALASDGFNGAIICWRDDRSGSWEIWAQRVDSAGSPLWGINGLLISTSVGPDGFPEIIPDGAGGAILTWQSVVGDILAQRIDPFGASLWTPNGHLISAQAWPEEWPILVEDGAGGAIIAWIDTSFPRSLLAQRVDPFGILLWGPGAFIGPTDSITPRIAPDGAGGAYLAWKASAEVWVEHLDAAGVGLASPPPVSTPGFDKQEPVIVADGFGGAIIAWTDVLPPPDNGDVFTQRMDSAGTALWGLDGVPVATDSANQFYPSLVSDGQGGALLAWDVSSGPGDGDIYSMKVLPNGRLYLLPFPDSSFVEWQGLVCSNTTPLVCPGGDGSQLHMVLKNAAGQPMDSVQVLAGMIPACIPSSGAGAVNRGYPQSGLTDVNGELILPVHAGLDVSATTACCEVDMIVASLQVTIPWKGTGAPFDRRFWLSPDLNGDCLVDLTDATIMTPDIGQTGICRTDFDCNGVVSTSDQAVLVTHLNHLCTSTVGVEETELLPEVGVLEQNHPNPFTRETRIAFSTVASGPVSLRIYDTGGRLVRTLLDSGADPRRYEVTWDGRDDNGRPMPSGIYFYRAISPGMDSVKRLILIR